MRHGNKKLATFGSDRFDDPGAKVMLEPENIFDLGAKGLRSNWTKFVLLDHCTSCSGIVLCSLWCHLCFLRFCLLSS